MNVPVRAILVAAVFNMLFGLLYLGKVSSIHHSVFSLLLRLADNLATGPAVAFNAYCASCTIFLNMSYAIPVSILLLRGRKLISKNPPVFYLGHVVGYLVNWISVLFVFITSFVSDFPT